MMSTTMDRAGEIEDKITMADITIIRLDPSRWQQSKALRLEALQNDSSAFGGAYEDEVQFDDAVWQHRAQSSFEGKGNITLFGEVDGKLVGMIGFGWTDRIKMRHVASIYGVYLTPSARGKGLASIMLTAVLDEIRQIPYIEKVSLSVTEGQDAALALYKKFGFEMIGTARKDIKIGDTYYDLCLMERFL